MCFAIPIMAQVSLRQDSCSYKEQLRQSVGPGMYMLSMPANDCGGCGKDIPADPYLRWQSWGPGFCQPGAAVDTGSELLGLNYKATKCSAQQYLPGKNANNACVAPGKQEARACMAPTENTRLSNPPCTLRGTGWNRWEWLCENPQDRAIIPFEWNVNYRIVAKDNHKPCIPQLLDQNVFQPSAKQVGTGTSTGAGVPNSIHTWTPPAGCGADAPGTDFMPTWQKCRDVRQM